MRFRVVLLAFAFLSLSVLTKPSTAARPERVTAAVESIAYQQPTTTTIPTTTTTTAAPLPPSTTTSTTSTTMSTTAVVEEAPAPPSGSIEDAIAAWFPDLYQQAWNVSQCESGHDPSAVSPGGGNYGLFQINGVHASDFTAVTGQPFRDGVLDANFNAQYARKLYDDNGGWGPWSCKWAANR